MVNADDVVQPAGAVDAADPPAEAVLAHPIPVVQGVAPELAVGAEIVGRHTGYGLGNQRFIQLEELRLRPHVSGIHGHIDGQVADDADALRVDIVAQPLPLAEEQVLQIGEEIHILLQQGTVFLQRLRLPQADIVGPLRPRLHAEMALARHEQGIVWEPALICLHEGGHGLAAALPVTLEGLAQQVEALFVDAAVVHMTGIAAPLAPAALGLGQQTVGDEQLGVNVVGVTGVGGEALVGGIPVAGRAKRQHLPVALARRVEEIRKIVCRLPQRADPVGGGQGGDGHQNTTGTFHGNKSLSIEN